MKNEKLVPINKLNNQKLKEVFNDKSVLVVSAGFEERVLAFPRFINDKGYKFKKVIVVDYNNKSINEPTRSKLIEITKKFSAFQEILSLENDKKIFCDSIQGNEVVVDLSGFDRVQIFLLLYTLDEMMAKYNIVYTEAEKYYPLKNFYNEIKKGTENSDQAFDRYLDKEKIEFAYSYNCSLKQPKVFKGELEPSKQFYLIAFLAFKRSRLQAILQELEITNLICVLSSPVRKDLHWRKELQKIVNWDLIRKSKCIELETLSPWKVVELLENITYKNMAYSKFNLVLAPLGSKMQTFGCYLFWYKHKEVSILFSKPDKYFKATYSESYRDTFLITGEDITRMKS